MPRLSENVGVRVQAGVDALPVPQAIKDGIEWELVPGILPRGGETQLGYVLILSLPVPDTADDFEAPMAQLPDAHASQAEINELVRVLYGEAQSRADERISGRQAALADGTRTSLSGLIIPS